MAKHGGARKGAGRKTSSVENDVRSHIRAACTEEDMLKIWQNVVKEAKTGSEKHIQVLFNYFYGKPKENEGQPSEMIIRVVRRS